MPVSTPAPAIIALALLCAPMSAQTLLKDFNTTPSQEAGDSNPSGFWPISGNRLLFAAGAPDSGREFWTTDGTVAGTSLLVDAVPGSVGIFPSQLTELSPGVYVFTTPSPGNGTELWRTDGTATGTYLVKDIRPGPEGASIGALTRVGSEVAFLANDGVHGKEPWRSDGTAAGTQMIADTVPNGGVGTSNGAASLGNGSFVYGARIGGINELWVSDLTAAGTMSIYQFGSSSTYSPSGFRQLGNKVLFGSRDNGMSTSSHWVTDGTPAGTLSLGVDSSPNPSYQLADTYAYFRGYDGATGWEVWRTDGTIAGTSLVIDLMPGGGTFGDSTPWFLGALNGDVLFWATAPGGRRLWRSDGTTAGTVGIHYAVAAGVSNAVDWGTEINGELWYRIPFGFYEGLYRTDGTTAGTVQVTTLTTSSIGNLGNTVFLAADDGTPTGNELYTSDGTPVGTQLFLDIAPAPVSLGSNPFVRGTFQDRAIVFGEQAATGREIWMTDGTPQGTEILIDLEPGPASPGLSGLAAGDRQMMFFADVTGHDGDPWISDGTTAGTVQLDLMPNNSGFRGYSIVPFGDRFVFSGSLPAAGQEPWITDGTPSGTFQLADIVTGSQGSLPEWFYPFGERVLFTVYDATSARQLWSTDGTPTGTVQIAAMGAWPVPHFAFLPVAFQGRLWFAAWDAQHGIELWSSDGTPGGTSLAVDLQPGTGSSQPFSLMAVGGRLLMRANLSGQSQLVSTDGTAAGTTAINTGAPEFVGPIAANDQRAVFFLPGSGNQQDEMWATDGTQTGTVMVRMIETRIGTNLPENAKVGNDRVLIVLDDQLTGLEAWATDGTTAGTFPVFDLAPGDSWPRDLHRCGEHVVFVADDGVHGTELFGIPLALSNDWAVESYGSGCPGTGGITPAIGLTGAAQNSAGSFSIDLDDALANTLAVFAVSTERGATAIPGCTLWLGGAVSLQTTTTDAQGHGTMPIVASTALVGVQLDAQYFVLDPAGTALGFLSATAALEVIAGP